MLKPDIEYLNQQIYRNKLIKTLKSCIHYQKYRNYENVNRSLSELIDEISKNRLLSLDKFISDFKTDLDGQIKEAFNLTEQGLREDWYNKWGKHYILSLINAYNQELCNNFKDPGVNNFKGETFIMIQEQISDLFDSMDPPKQDIVHTQTSMGGFRGGSVAPSQQFSSQSFNNMGGGCCVGESNVLMANNQYKMIKDLKRGDEVISYDENFNIVIDKIECLVITETENNQEMLCNVNNLSITPYHPILYNNCWIFPIDISIPSIKVCSYVYTLVTESRNSINVDGFIYATLGHDLSGNKIQHDYLGTIKVINDLKNFISYSNGFVHLKKSMFKRENGVINKIDF
jgi:flagellar biosynthesis chaperone FliJ